MKDLYVLVADKDMEFLLKGLLPRMPKVYNLREFSFAIEVHSLHDAGCRAMTPYDFSDKAYQGRYALLLFDYEGSGANVPHAKLVQEMEDKLQLIKENGWFEDMAVVVIEPELENWVWVNSPHLATAIDWDSIDDLHQWLDKEGLKPLHQPKPNRPKEAFEQALFKSKMPRSSSIYKEIAEKASFKKCIDANFHKLRDMLIRWFAS